MKQCHRLEFKINLFVLFSGPVARRSWGGVGLFLAVLILDFAPEGLIVVPETPEAVALALAVAAFALEMAAFVILFP